MKKYYSLGELLAEYRRLNNQTQSDLAAVLSVDIRTIARWEKNETLINPDKVADVVEATFIPYQVVHNLNSPVPLPVYYDFRIRKYSLTAIEKELPDIEWFRARMEAVSERVRPTTTDKEIESIMRYHRFLYPTDKPVGAALIRQAAQLLPEMNYVLYDTAGFYAGHHVVFPISVATHEKLKNRELVAGDLRETHLRNYKTEAKPAFFTYSVYADSNENFYYLTATFLRFLKDFPKDYIFGALMVRYDALNFATQIGFNVIWEDKEEQEKLKMIGPPTFLEGKLNPLFSGNKNRA